MSPDPAMLPTHGPDSKYDIILEGVRYRGNLTFTPDSDSMLKVGIPTTHIFLHLEMHTCIYVHVHCRELHAI